MLPELVELHASLSGHPVVKKNTPSDNHENFPDRKKENHLFFCLINPKMSKTRVLRQVISSHTSTTFSTFSRFNTFRKMRNRLVIVRMNVEFLGFTMGLKEHRFH